MAQALPYTVHECLGNKVWLFQSQDGTHQGSLKQITNWGSCLVWGPQCWVGGELVGEEKSVTIMPDEPVVFGNATYIPIRDLRGVKHAPGITDVRALET